MDEQQQRVNRAAEEFAEAVNEGTAVINPKPVDGTGGSTWSILENRR